MKPQPPKPARCAIYTRKSTEHNLDLEFNSLDAQREACEAYIKSQAQEGWRLIPDRYDDGGLSGASLDRPALRTLLSEVQAGKIDTVVVYKVDRLTRSLGDFAKLVELFDQHSVSFVSVTQSFNTTTSMGRLTLNVLLSFAQFEREVIGERVRDKIAASKKKGLWVGGPIPLGYASVNKKLVVVRDEAETVRMIFQQYLELGSIGDLTLDLDRKGVRTKRQVLTSGRIRGGCCFGVGPLGYLLRNRFYIGEIDYGGEIHRGEHEPILDRPVFDAVQAKLAANAVDRQLRLKGSPAILAGRLFDDRGNRMTPTHTNKNGVRYRYYVSHPILQKQRESAGNVTHVPAPEIEALVIKELRDCARAREMAEHSLPENDRDLVECSIERVVIRPDSIEVRLINSEDPSHAATFQENDAVNSKHSSQEPTILTVPWSDPSFAAVKGILHAPVQGSTLKPEARDALLTAIAKARRWIDDIVQGRVDTFAEIAKREGKVERHIRLLAPLAFVSPQVVALINNETASKDLTITRLARSLPYRWDRQEHLVSRS